MNVNDLMDAWGAVPEEYIAEAMEETEPSKRTAFLVSKPFLAGVSTAACLLLIVGVGVGVWSRQQRIEPLPPQETQTTTVMQTETRTETTAQITSESQTTWKQTETSKKAPESTAISAIVTDRVQPPTSEAAHLTTGSMPQTTVTIPTQTIAAVGSTEPPTPDTLPPHTALPQTSLTARIPDHGVPVAECTSETVTQPPDSPATIHSESQVESTTNSPYEPDFSKDFHVSEPDANNWISVTYQKPLKPSPEEFRHYTLPAEQYTVEFVSEQETFYKRHRGYDILSADGTKHYSIAQDERDEFQFNCRQDDELRYLTVGSYPAVLVQNATRSILRWDDGQYAFSITGDPEEWEILLEIAQSLTPTETITE